jgi:fructose-bisphosphate aldolase, class II
MTTVAGYDKARSIFLDAKQKNYALPAVNVINTNTINAVLETAGTVNSPVIIQLSHGGAHFFVGKSTPNSQHQASVQGAVAAAKYAHAVSELYQTTVLLNTDHASKKLLGWIDGMLDEGEKHFQQYGRPLFTSHMLDLSEQSLEENIEISKRYLERMTKLNMYLEIELGVTGGEEDGVDNSNIDSSKLYTQPEEVAYAYRELMKVSDHFVIAASFGNVHGVYKPGNVQLEPVILGNSQALISEKYGTGINPVNFVFHGGSGSEPEKIVEAIRYGVIKMNIDTDIQWAFWDGVRQYYTSKMPYMQAQIGNPEGEGSPNKKYYDPRTWLRQGEVAIGERLRIAFQELNCLNRSVPGIDSTTDKSNGASNQHR